MGHSQVAMQTFEVEPGPGQGVLHMVNDAKLVHIYLYWIESMSLGM